MNSSPLGDRPLHILHLEDHATDRALIHETLRNGGLRCEIRHAATRTEFEAALLAASYDLIISDFTLPAYDGAAALQGASFLHKPYQPAELAQMIRATLDQGEKVMHRMMHVLPTRQPPLKPQ